MTSFYVFFNLARLYEYSNIYCISKVSHIITVLSMTVRCHWPYALGLVTARRLIARARARTRTHTLKRNWNYPADVELWSALHSRHWHCGKLCSCENGEHLPPKQWKSTLYYCMCNINFVLINELLANLKRNKTEKLHINI